MKVDLGDEVDGAALDEGDLAPHVVGERGRPVMRWPQGYFAHQKTQPPLGPPYVPRQSPSVGS